jgi:flavorubredoxin
METRVTEIASGIYRLSTFVDRANLTFNVFVVDGEEPLLFHTGMRSIFPLVSEALARVMKPERLRWITFSHYEGDECGAMNDWLALAPGAEVAHGPIGVRTSIGDQASRPPRMLADGEVLDLGGKRMLRIETPHVPHGWDAGLFFEETTKTLLCSDLFTAYGACADVTESDVVEPALTADRQSGATCVTPATGPTLRKLADLQPSLLAPMHASAFAGDGAAALRALAASYEERILAAAK